MFLLEMLSIFGVAISTGGWILLLMAMNANNHFTLMTVMAITFTYIAIYEHPSVREQVLIAYMLMAAIVPTINHIAEFLAPEKSTT